MKFDHRFDAEQFARLETSRIGIKHKAVLTRAWSLESWTWESYYTVIMEG